MRSALARIILVGAMVLAPLGSFHQAAPAPVVPKPRPEIAQSSKAKSEKFNYGTVVLLRGLINIFSFGMNELSRDLRKEGVSTTTANHSRGDRIAASIAKHYQTDKSTAPIILIGHSLGANEVVVMAKRLNEQNVPVRLLVLFDATVAVPVPSNVKEVLNLYKPGSVGVAVEGGEGFKGSIDNRDVSAYNVGHISIDKNRDLHALVANRVLEIMRASAPN